MAAEAVVAGLTALYNVYNTEQSKKASKSNTGIDYNTAYKEAASYLNPKYRASRQSTLSNLTSNLQNRGLYGQAAGSSVLANAAASNEGNRISDIASTALGLQSNSATQAAANNQAAVNSVNQQAQYGNTALKTLGNMDWDYILSGNKSNSTNGTINGVG